MSLLFLSIRHSRKVAAPEEFASITETEMAVKPPAYHRLVQTGPDGRKTLYVAAHAKRILGWPDDKGLALINELLDWCSQPVSLTVSPSLPMLTICSEIHHDCQVGATSWSARLVVQHYHYASRNSIVSRSLLSSSETTDFLNSSDQMEIRDMRRTTVFDDSPDANGLPNAHERELRGQLPAA